MKNFSLDGAGVVVVEPGVDGSGKPATTRWSFATVADAVKQRGEFPAADLSRDAAGRAVLARLDEAG